MAQVPAAAASVGLSAAATSAITFAVNLGASYLLSRLTAQDGPRLDNLSAAGGEYGVAMPRAYGEVTRLTGIFIAQADIEETKHTVGSTELNVLIGAGTGALEGFMLGGPVGAAVGAVVGGLLGAAMPKQHYYTYSDSLALLLCDRTGMPPIEGVAKIFAAGKTIFSGAEAVVSQTLDGDGKLVVRKYGQNRYFKSLTVYGGSTLQGVDPVLASLLAEDGAYPFSAYLVFERLQLVQFGNAVPPMEALTRVATGQSIADTVELIAGAAGIDPLRDFASTALNDFLNRGYAVTSESNCWDAVKPLLPGFAVDAAEVAGQVRFYRRAQAMRATIPLGDMGAYAAGDSAAELFIFNRGPDLKLPNETSLTFLDPSRDYLPNTATSRRSEGDAKSNVTVSIPLALTASEGASAAALMHWDAWLGRTQVGFALTDNWNPVVGQAYGIPVGDVVLPYRIQRSTRGANGVTEIEAVSDEAVTYTASVPGTSGTLPDDDETAMPDTRVVIMDSAITADVHDDYGFYLAIAGTASYWPRGYVQLSGNGGTNWVTVLDTPDGAVMGDVLAILGAGPTSALDDTLDTVSVLDVELLHDGMELASATDAELDAWKNFAFVGKDGQGEYVQFKTATKLAPRTWRLTNLRRGRKGSDWALGLHGAAEEFVLLGGDGVLRAVYSDTLKWGVPMKARGVTLHQDEADAAIVDFTNTGEGKRPYSPVEVEGTWDGSFNLTITFTHRSRMNAGGLGVDDNFEFDVEILSGAGRTITVTVESAGYTAAEQAADGITPGDTIVGRVRQTSDVNDGRWRIFELIGPITIVALETDAALALGMLVGRSAGRADEADTALALTPPVTTPVGRADETDIALALSTTAGAPVGRADETDVALALIPPVTTPVGRANETDAALALTATALDTYFDLVKLLMGFEGTNGSTTFTDESGSPVTFSVAAGSPAITTGQSKFGSSSLGLNGTSNISTPGGTVKWQPTTDDWTLEYWVRHTNADAGTARTYFKYGDHGAGITSCSQGHLTASGGTWDFGLRGAAVGSLEIQSAGSQSISAGSWFHVCHERQADKIRGYIDGVMKASVSGITDAVLDNASNALVIGGDLDGQIDELRFTIGLARYGSDAGFTPPAAAFPRSVGTPANTPTVVQDARAITNASSSATFAAAPTNGNLLIAFCTHWNNANTLNSAAGWRQLKNTNGSSVDGLAIAWKIAGASESATQQPYTFGAAGNNIAIIEVANARSPSLANMVTQTETSTASLSKTSIAAPMANCLVVGAFFAISTALTATLSNVTQVGQTSGNGTATSGTPRCVTTFKHSPASGATVSAQATYSSAVWQLAAMVTLLPSA
jgi:hypothetical protein